MEMMKKQDKPWKNRQIAGRTVRYQGFDVELR